MTLGPKGSKQDLEKSFPLVAKKAQAPTSPAKKKVPATFEQGQALLSPSSSQKLPGKLKPNPARDALLSKMLVDTGRANAVDNPSGKLGGPRTKDADQKAEASSGKVLGMMESATRENQTKHNQKTGESRPLTHAVSGHGKGTNQVDRLVHGRRADEVTEDTTKGTVPTSKVALEGNTNGLENASAPEYSTVGSDPSNISGAFTTNLGMLQVVNEAFAQANLVTQYARGERSKGNDESIDQGRFVSTLSVTGQEIGYNLSVSGKGSQSTGDAVTPTEMQDRYKSVQKTDNLTNATVVLDPAYVDGKRAGWNMQTAYANNDTLSDSYAKPDQVGKGLHVLQSKKQVADQAVKDKKTAVDNAERELEKVTNSAKKLGGVLTGQKKRLAADPTNAKAIKAVSSLEQKVKDLNDSIPDLQKVVDDAKADLKTAEDEQTAIATKISSHTPLN